MTDPTRPPKPDHAPVRCIRCQKPRTWEWRRYDSRWVGGCTACKARRRKERAEDRMLKCKLSHAMGHIYGEDANCKGCGRSWEDQRYEAIACHEAARIAEEKRAKSRTGELIDAG